MVFLYIVGGILFILLIFKAGGKKLEDNEVTKNGGLRVIYSDYFAYLKEGFPNTTIAPEQGSVITYSCMISETRVQFEFRSQCIQGHIFTIYKIYISNSGSLKLLHTSEKYRFENARINQFDMFEAIAIRVVKDNDYWSHVANVRYPNRD